MGLRTWIRGQVGRLQQKQARPQAAFEAARRGRLTSDFIQTTLSADAEIRSDLETLRNGARALCRDSPHARGIKRTYRVNAIGPRGIRLRPQIKMLRGGGLDKEANEYVLKAYEHWSNKSYCDVTGYNSLLSFQWLIATALVESGEIFFRIVRREFGGSGIPLALEVIETDQLDVNENGISDRLGHKWRMGIETNEWNRPTRYKFLTEHPGNTYFRDRYFRDRHVIYDAADIIHVYGLPERVGQTRFEPILSPIILESQHLRKYKGAHLIKKRSQANQLGWIQTPDGDIPSDAVVDGRRVVNNEAGQWNRLNPGEIPVPPNFGPEDSTFPEVIKDSLRTQAVGTGTNYSTISGDFSEGSYASLRISVFENRDNWKMVHTAIIDQFCQRVYEEFLNAAVISGYLPSSKFMNYWINPERYTHARWQARSWGLLDTSKDISAIKDARELQLETHSEQISNYTGEDFEGTIDEIALEEAYKAERLAPADPVSQSLTAPE